MGDERAPDEATGAEDGDGHHAARRQA
jgi:hypothetical protein